MASWSLRTKLVAVAALAMLPAVGIVAWRAQEDVAANGARRAAVVAAAAELVVSRHREAMEASRRLLLATCADDAVRRAAATTSTRADLERCSAYLSQVMANFSVDYSAALVTDESGIARCSSISSAIGVNVADREIFRMVRDAKGVVVGPSVASRVTPRTIVPVAMSIRNGERFLGMCALGIALRPYVDTVTAPTSASGVSIVLVDRSGTALGGDADAVLALPVAPRMATAISGRRTAFSDYGQDGAFYHFHVAALTEDAIFVVAAIPQPEGLASLLEEWGLLALVVVGLVAALSATWLAADRWCVRPLHQVQDFAGKVARGETITLGPLGPRSSELIALANGVNAMADAIASREAALRAGLEERDHMLREIHHRVKNNLQMISSLLNLQAGEIRSPRIRRFFGDAQNRVLTLSILHRHLYERSSWSLVDFQQFISDLVRQLSVSRPGADRPTPRYHIRAPIMAVGPDVAIPVGLIVTEAVGSALNHDFSAVAQPEIRIDAIERGDQQVELVIEDNGRDVNRSSISAARPVGFGLTLVRGLAMQLGGSAQVGTGEAGGTRVVVTFALPSEGPADG